ncbi:MAG: hypothetical protein ABI693_05200 [Bryobacteraceae bacterium]
MTGPATFLSTNYIAQWDAFWGLEFNGAFEGATNSGLAGVFYTDSPCTQGGREYGVAHNWVDGHTQLYWSAKTNCGTSGTAICWNSSTQRLISNQLPQLSDAVDINTAVVPPSQAWVYEIWFTGGKIYCEVKNATTFAPIPNAFFSHTGFSYNVGNTVFSGPVPSYFVAPAPMALSGAGYLFATVVPTIVNPTGNAVLRTNWIKAAK